MMEITIPSDCNHSPKREMLANFNIAFAKGDVQYILNHLADDVVWEMIGDKIINGKMEVEQLLNEMSLYKAKEIKLFQVVSHGKEASAHGVLIFENQKIAFADFYTFTSAGSKIIKRISSYAIDLK